MQELYILLGLYVLAGTGVSIAVMGKNQSQRDFFVGGGAIGWFVSAMTYGATTYSAFMMVGLVGLSYASGIGALVFEMVYLIATIALLSTYGHRIWRLAQEHQLVSPMELFGLRYGEITARVGAVVAAVALVPYAAVQVIGLAVILEGYGIGFSTGVGFGVGVIALWTLLGGLRGVALTDVLQGIFMVSMAVAALVWVQGSYGGNVLSTFPNQVWTPAFFVNLTLPWAFFALTNPQVLQRMFILDRVEDLRKMILLFGLFGGIYTLLVTFIGFGAKFGTVQGLLPEVAARDQVIVAVMGEMGQGLAVPVALSIVFASVSTANSILLTLSSLVTRNLLDRRRESWSGRVILLLLTGLVGIFALQRPDTLVELSVASSRILMVFLPLLFGIFHLKQGGPWSGVLTLVGGFILSLVWGGWVPGYSSILTLISASALFALGLMLDRSGQ